MKNASPYIFFKYDDKTYACLSNIFHKDVVIHGHPAKRFFRNLGIY